jgi:ABC-type iron transport system FetAB ATPase subunit
MRTKAKSAKIPCCFEKNLILKYLAEARRVMNDTKSPNDILERLKIQEQALSNLADSLKRHEVKTVEEIKDIQAELKALMLFLARNIPEFKKQFPEIQKKVK